MPFATPIASNSHPTAFSGRRDAIRTPTTGTAGTTPGTGRRPPPAEVTDGSDDPTGHQDEHDGDRRGPDGHDEQAPGEPRAGSVRSRGRHGTPPPVPRGPSRGVEPIDSQMTPGAAATVLVRRHDLAARRPRSAAARRCSRRRPRPCTRGGRRRRPCRRSPCRCSPRCPTPISGRSTTSHPTALSSVCRSCIAIAHRSARSAWSGSGSGAPNTAITASPWNLSIVPPCAATTSAIAERCLPTTAATSRAGRRSAIVEKPRMSLNSTVTSTSCGSIAVFGCEASWSASCCGHERRERVARFGLFDDRRVQALELVDQAGAPPPSPAIARNSSVTWRSTASWVVPSASAISA